jgi:hypothetical protein
MEGPPPKQQQMPSASEAAMKPRPVAVDVRHVGSGKLHHKARCITALIARRADAVRFVVRAGGADNRRRLGHRPRGGGCVCARGL